MTDVTQILSRIDDGDPTAAEQLLPPVCKELRKLAAANQALVFGYSRKVPIES